MKKPYSILAAAAIMAGGLALVGCHNNNPDTAPTASVGGVGGGGSTDSYGTGPDARMRGTGNVGINSGQADSNNGVTPQPAAVNERAVNNQPPQTPTSPAGGTGGAYAPDNGAVQGSTTGNAAGAGVRSSTITPGASNSATNGNNTGNTGNGTRNAPAPVPGSGQ